MQKNRSFTVKEITNIMNISVCSSTYKILTGDLELKRVCARWMPHCQPWILHRDNATPHTAHIAPDFLKKYGIRMMPHYPYSADLAPCNFSLFLKLKKTTENVVLPVMGLLLKPRKKCLKALR